MTLGESRAVVGFSGPLTAKHLDGTILKTPNFGVPPDGQTHV